MPTYKHLSTQDIEAGLPHVLEAPKNHGELLAIVTRPAHGERVEHERCQITAAEGVVGDHWFKGSWKSLPDGRPDPDVQVSIIGSRFINLIGTSRDNWAPSGNNLFVDMDVSFENLPANTRLAIGTVELEVSAVAHTGCQFFIDRYGRDACVFINRGKGRDLRLHGVYARVIRDGIVTLGDRLAKLA